MNLKKIKKGIQNMILLAVLLFPALLLIELCKRNK
nr:MAG TPA: hypothetical protein [Caudoviricetes sp.]